MTQKKKTVLLIEDETALQEAVKMKFKKKGIEVLSAETGEKGLSLLKKKKADLVWLDILLPGIDGLEVLKRIRKAQKTKNLPVLVVSVSSGQEKIRQAFALNVIDYLVKSEYKIDDIVEKVIKILTEKSKIQNPNVKSSSKSKT